MEKERFSNATKTSGAFSATMRHRWHFPTDQTPLLPLSKAETEQYKNGRCHIIGLWTRGQSLNSMQIRKKGGPGRERGILPGSKAFKWNAQWNGFISKPEQVPCVPIWFLDRIRQERRVCCHPVPSHESRKTQHTLLPRQSPMTRTWRASTSLVKAVSRVMILSAKCVLD